jgi:hypothetical protein
MSLDDVLCKYSLALIMYSKNPTSGDFEMVELYRNQLIAMFKDIEHENTQLKEQIRVFNK